jgi:hypothetical protein
MISRNDCRHYDECSAPLCPRLSEEENKKGMWYPVEEICKRRKDLPVWVNRQRKIAVKAKAENHVFYFTLDMLKIPLRVTPSIKGLDSDGAEEAKQLRAWFKKYKGTKKRNLSAKQRQEKRKAISRARKIREKKTENPVGINSSGDASASPFLSENGATEGHLLSENRRENMQMGSVTSSNQNKEANAFNMKERL